MTVGKIYAGLLIAENWKAFKISKSAGLATRLHPKTKTEEPQQSLFGSIMNVIKASPSAMSLTSWHSEKADAGQIQAHQMGKDGLPWSGDKTMRDIEKNSRQSDLATVEEHHHSLRQEDRLQQHERQQQERLQHERLPQQERLQHDRLPQEHLQHDRLPQEHLQHDRLPHERFQQHTEHQLPTNNPPSYQTSVQQSVVDGGSPYNADAGPESRQYHGNTGPALQNNPGFISQNSRGYPPQNNAGYAAMTGRPTAGIGRNHPQSFGGGPPPGRTDNRESYANMSPNLQRNGVTSASFADRGLNRPRGGEEFQTIHVTGMRNSPSMNKLGSLFTSINKSVSNAFVNLIAAPPPVGESDVGGHSPYETLPNEGMRKAPYYTGLTGRGAHRGGVGGGCGHSRDERFLRGDSRDSNGATRNPGAGSRYPGENVGINRGYHEESSNLCSTMQRPISTDMGRHRIDSVRIMPHGRPMPENIDNVGSDDIGPASRTYTRSHSDQEKRNTEMLPADTDTAHPTLLDTNAASTKLGRDSGANSARRTPIAIPRASTGHPQYNPPTLHHPHEGGKADRGFQVLPPEHGSNVLRQRDINNSARNFTHPSFDSSRHRLHPAGESAGIVPDPRYHRRSPPYRSTSLETRSRTPSPTNDRYRVSLHPEYYGKTNLTDRSRSPSPPTSAVPPKRPEGGPGPSPPQKPTELNFSNKRRNSRGSMPQMLPSPTVPPPDASSPSCINFPRLYPSPTHMVVPSPVSTTTTVSPGNNIPGASNPHHPPSGSRQPFRQPPQSDFVQRKPFQQQQQQRHHRYDDNNDSVPPRGGVKCQSRETVNRQASVQEIRLRSNVTLPRRRDVGFNQHAGVDSQRRPTSYPPRDLEEVDDSDSDDEGWC